MGSNYSVIIKYGLVAYISILMQGCTSNPTESEFISSVRNKPYSIQNIKSPSEAVQLAAVMKDGRAIDKIYNPSEAVQLAAIKQTSLAFNLISNPSSAVKYAAKLSASKDLYTVFINGKTYDIWEYDRASGNISASAEVEILKSMKEAIKRYRKSSPHDTYGDVSYMTSSYRRFMSKVKTKPAQLLVINESTNNIGRFKTINATLLKHPKVIAYKQKQRIAELQRKKEEAEYSKRRKRYSNSSSSSSSSSSNSYSQPSYSPPEKKCRVQSTYVNGRYQQGLVCN